MLNDGDMRTRLTPTPLEIALALEMRRNVDIHTCDRVVVYLSLVGIRASMAAEGKSIRPQAVMLALFPDEVMYGLTMAWIPEPA